MKPKDYVEECKEVVHDEFHADVLKLRALAAVLFVLGFLLGALLF